jgi:hypothetical protein
MSRKSSSMASINVSNIFKDCPIRRYSLFFVEDLGKSDEMLVLEDGLGMLRAQGKNDLWRPMVGTWLPMLSHCVTLEAS